MKRHRRSTRWHSLAFLVMTLCMANAGWAKAESPPANPAAVEEKPVTPQLVISFERQTIRENDLIPVRVLLTNPSDKSLQDVSLSWKIPSNFLVVYPEACGKSLQEMRDNYPAEKYPAGPPPLQWKMIPPQNQSGSAVAADLCLVSSTANEGDFNLLFELRYSWQIKDGMNHAAMTVEKPIRSAFLGSDTLAGIPLGLAGFIVPGLLFWLMLEFWRTPWRIQGPGLGDKMIYSVLISLILIALVSFFPALKGRLDITRGLSLAKLEGLALLGAISGILVGLADNKWRGFQTRRSIHATDDEYDLLAKLLRLNGGKRWPKTTVKIDGVDYVGSMGVPTATDTILLGWYQITGDTTRPELTKQMTDLVKRGELYQALKIAQHNKFMIAVREGVEKLVAGVRQPTADSLKIAANTKVEGGLKVETEETNLPPLSMA